GKTPQVDRLETEATEPEEVGEETHEWSDQDRDEKKDKDDDREDDHPARRTRYAVAAPAETREVDIRPVDVSPVPAPVTATPALAHPSLRIGVVSFTWSLGALRPLLGVSNFPQRGQILDFDQVLVPTCGAFHPDQ